LDNQLKLLPQQETPSGNRQHNLRRHLTHLHKHKHNLRQLLAPSDKHKQNQQRQARSVSQPNNNNSQPLLPTPLAKIKPLPHNPTPSEPRSPQQEHPPVQRASMPPRQPPQQQQQQTRTAPKPANNTHL
jgi:hypothetical protein